MQIAEVLVSMPDGSKQPFSVMEGYPLKPNSFVKGEFPSGPLQGQKRTLSVRKEGDNYVIETDTQTELVLTSAYAQMKVTGKTRVNVNLLKSKTGFPYCYIRKLLEKNDIQFNKHKHISTFPKTPVAIDNSSELLNAAQTICRLNSEQRRMVVGYLNMIRVNTDIYCAVNKINNADTERQKLVLGLLEMESTQQ